MGRKIFSGIDSILLEFHNKVKDDLQIISNGNDVPYTYSSLSRLFDLMTLENERSRITNEESRTNMKHSSSLSRTLDEGTSIGTNTQSEKSESHQEDTSSVGESDNESYSDSSFIPEDDSEAQGNEK
jgi:hypothetical protein